MFILFFFDIVYIEFFTKNILLLFIIIGKNIIENLKQYLYIHIIQINKHFNKLNNFKYHLGEEKYMK